MSTTESDRAAIKIDGAAMRLRRQQLGISERALARDMGPQISVTVIRNLENNVSDSELTLGELRRLGALLDVPPAALLTSKSTATDVASSSRDSDTPHGPDTQEQVESRAAQRIGALLQATGKPVPEDVLADVLGYDLSFLDSALRRLDISLAAAGLRLRRVHREVAIVPTHDATTSPPEEDLRDVLRRHYSRRGFTKSEAVLLRKVIHGEVVRPAANADQQIRSRALLNAGILEAGQDGRLVVSEDVAYSLDV